MSCLGVFSNCCTSPKLFKYSIEKILHVGEPTQFKPMMFKGQLCVCVHMVCSMVISIRKKGKAGKWSKSLTEEITYDEDLKEVRQWTLRVLGTGQRNSQCEVLEAEGSWPVWEHLERRSKWEGLRDGIRGWAGAGSCKPSSGRDSCGRALRKETPVAMWKGDTGSQGRGGSPMWRPLH